MFHRNPSFNYPNGTLYAFSLTKIYLMNKETQQILWVIVSRLCNVSMVCNWSYYIYMKPVPKGQIIAGKKVQVHVGNDQEKLDTLLIMYMHA